MSINNWSDLINSIVDKNYGAFPKLLLRINQFLKSQQKSDPDFNLQFVTKNHSETFNTHKLVYEQLLIENDIRDISVEIPSLTSKCNIIFNMVGIGKWIKIHSGNASRIFFFDEEKTIISDKSLADFLNKIDTVRAGYKYFGKEPVIYYKFRTLPSTDVIEHLLKFNILPISFDESTLPIIRSTNFDDKILLDQTMIFTLCSNLSYGLSESYYRTPEDKNKEFMMKNKEELDSYIANKTVMVNQFVYDQTKVKFDFMGGSSEKQRFTDLCEKITIVADEKNPRFEYLKDIELVCVSVAERETATIVTSSQRMCNKIDTYYQEIPYKLFFGAQLVETKYA
jgi:hypothetical protein